MADFRADLHMHSQCSDGHWTAAQLIEQAHSSNIQAISITDHDTLEAYPDALMDASKLGLQMIPGIELSTFFNELSIHVLGYSFDLSNPVLSTPLKALAEDRAARIEAILARLAKRNIHISLEELKQTFDQNLLARPHIAQMLVHKGYSKNIEQAFQNYLSDKHVGSLKLKSLSTEEGIELIHKAGGFAVLAHPHLIKQKKKLKALLELPFDGIEAFYGTYQEKTEMMCRMAADKDMFVTGGSDFHYPKPYQPLGCSYTPEEVFKTLHQRAKQNNDEIT